MKKKLSELYEQYMSLELQIKKELDKLGQDECNCNDQEEIDLVTTENHELGVERRCGNCGGVIWDREI